MTTSRERLQQTLNHQEPDRVVMDLGATAISGIHANALAGLRDALGLEKRHVRIFQCGEKTVETAERNGG